MNLNSFRIVVIFDEQGRKKSIEPYVTYVMREIHENSERTKELLERALKDKFVSLNLNLYFPKGREEDLCLGLVTVEHARLLRKMIHVFVKTVRLKAYIERNWEKSTTKIFLKKYGHFLETRKSYEVAKDEAEKYLSAQFPSRSQGDYTGHYVARNDKGELCVFFVQ